MDQHRPHRVSSKDLVRDFAQVSDRAIHDGHVVITKNGRDRLVLVSIDEYQQLTRPRAQK